MNLPLDKRPVIVVVAGPNGAGKSTFYHSHLREAGLRFINADVLAKELQTDAYAAAKLADVLRRQLMMQGESFVFETVFSDPAGDKMTFLKEAVDRGYNVVLCFIGLSSAGLSEERVCMRVTQGGHDVPPDKLVSRFPRTLHNLKLALALLPHVLIFDNSDLAHPFREVMRCESGQVTSLHKPIPKWLQPLLA
ncbi:MAG: Zeta toxin [Verrucomicrobia bacterium]|jgi:predicted ABC-type ATPase|nr:Zeta toxin [Verrucomicrobiota bacterium]